MTAQKGQPDTPPAPLAPDAPLRVILVGRTGLDAALRLDSAIELIRARTPLQALGELSDPIDETSPADVTVVVGPDAAVGQYASDFVEGLRLIEPRVRVYAARPDNDAAPYEIHMDGVIDPRKSADAIRRAVRGRIEAAAAARVTTRPTMEPARQAVGNTAVATPAPKPAASQPLRIMEPEPSVNGSGNGHAGAASSATGAGAAKSAAGPRAEGAKPDSQTEAPGGIAPARPVIVTPPEAKPKEASPSADEAPRAPDTGPSDDKAKPAAARKGKDGETEADGEPEAATDENSVLDAMLTGGDVLEAALDVVRAQSGAHDVVFIPGEGDSLIGARVSYRHRTLGFLRSVHASRDELARHADWVARWIVLRDQQNQLRTAAMTDELTGAYNRRYFTRFLAAAMDQARRNRTGVTLMAFDIDDFKVYNDRYGHPAGDDILKEVVRLLKSVIRPTDRVCRTGGDEFVVIFHEPTGPRAPDSKPPTSVFEIAKRFQRQVCEHHFPKLLEEAPGTLTISGGLATYPWDGRTAEELLERADQLALESKRQGKNAITLGPGAQRVCGVWD